MAGLIEHVSMLPLDNVKVPINIINLDSLASFTQFKIHVDNQNIKVMHCFKFRSHGMKAYFSGYGAVTIGCMPAHALYFSSYEVDNLFSISFSFLKHILMLMMRIYTQKSLP